MPEEHPPVNPELTLRPLFDPPEYYYLRAIFLVTSARTNEIDAAKILRPVRGVRHVEAVTLSGQIESARGQPISVPPSRGSLVFVEAKDPPGWKAAMVELQAAIRKIGTHTIQMFPMDNW